MVPTVADATRSRLLDVAGPLFAENGFRDTSVKRICDAAECNVAAINYHFGGKQEFYAEVLAHAHRQAFQGSPMPEPDSSRAPADELDRWLRWWIRSMLQPDNPVWLQTLMAREMVDPTPALDAMVQRSIRPMYERLTTLVRPLLPKGASIATVRACVHSVIGQALFYKHARPVVQRLGTAPELDAAGVERLAAHIATFSIAGIQAVAAMRGERKSRKERP